MSLGRTACSLAVIALCLIPLGIGRTQNPSTPEERRALVEVATKFIANPLDPEISRRREKAILWLIQVPDITVPLCTEVLGKFSKSKYKHSGEITAAMLLASAAFVIENQESAKNNQAIYMAGVEGALNAYQSILKNDAAATSAPLDELVQLRAKGELGQHVSKAMKKCK